MDRIVSARVGPGLLLQLSLDNQFTFNAMGGMDGKWCCNAPVDEAGVVDLRGFKALVAEARQDISQSGLRPEWFLALGDQESLMPLWAWLCEGPLVAETTLLISQVLWGIGQHMELRFHADFEALRNNTMPHEATAMPEAAVGSDPPPLPHRLVARVSLVVGLVGGGRRLAGRRAIAVDQGRWGARWNRVLGEDDGVDEGRCGQGRERPTTPARHRRARPHL